MARRSRKVYAGLGMKKTSKPFSNLNANKKPIQNMSSGEVCTVAGYPDRAIRASILGFRRNKPVGGHHICTLRRPITVKSSPKRALQG
jgi:hypothetical protein